MTDYKKMYTLLFNNITDTITSLQDIQQQAEQIYIDSSVSPLINLEDYQNKDTDDD